MSTEERIGPIRIGLRTLGSDGLRIEKSEGRGGPACPDGSVEDLIAKIEGIPWGEAVDLELIKQWASHPDERVRIALIRSEFLKGHILDPYFTEVADMVLEADEATRKEDELWNPTLDALASIASSGWRSGRLRRGSNGEGPDLRRDGPLVWIEQKVAPELRARGLSIDEAKVLLLFSRFFALTYAVPGLIEPDVDFVRWMEKNHPRGIHVLADREDLSIPVRNEVWRIALAGFANGVPEVSSSVIVSRLRERGKLPPNAFEDLLEVAEQMTPNDRHDVIGHLYSLLCDGRVGQGNPCGRLRRFYQLVRFDWLKVKAIVNFRSANERVWAHIAADTISSEIREMIAERFAWSALVRKALVAKETDYEIVKRIAPHTPEDELHEMLDRLAETNPMRAIDVLTRELVRSEADAARRKEACIRYFEQLLERDPRIALSRLEMVRRYLGEEHPRAVWIRKIVLGLIRLDSRDLNDFRQSYLDLLGPEDWKELIAVRDNKKTAARILLRIPRALEDPAVRCFIYRYGGRVEVMLVLERQPSMEREEARQAARGVLRVFRPDFEEALARWPELGNVLEPKDLAPLLTSKNQQIRQNAILLLGRLRERDAVEKTIGPKPGR